MLVNSDNRGTDTGSLTIGADSLMGRGGDRVAVSRDVALSDVDRVVFDVRLSEWKRGQP